MTVKPWAKATAATPGRPAPPPTTAAAPAPMNISAKVPMNSARSLAAIRLDIVDSRHEMTARRDQVCALKDGTLLGRPTARGAPSAGEAGQAYSAAIMFDFKLTPSAFATPAP